MRKFVVALVLLGILAVSWSQEEEPQFSESVDSEQFQGGAGGQPPQMSEEHINAMRSRTMSCILLTKHKIYGLQKDLGGILEGFSSKQSEQNALYRKIFVEMLETCYMHISDQDATKFMEEVQHKEFNVLDFDYIVESFKLEKFRGTPMTVSTEMNDIQKQLFKYAEEFDKVMKQKQEKEEEAAEEEKEREKPKPEDFEPKIAGFSLKNSPGLIKIGYIVAIAALFGIIIFWGK